MTDEVALAIVAKCVDQLMGERIDDRFERPDPVRPIGVVGQRPDLLMVRIVTAGQRCRTHPTLLAVHRLHRLTNGSQPPIGPDAGEPLSVEQDQLHVLISGSRQTGASLRSAAYAGYGQC